MGQGARLHVAAVAAENPTAWVLAVHGIFGRGGNLRTFARRVVDRRPDWGFLLADLRGHGKSALGAPPHTIDAAAADLVTLMRGEGAGEKIRPIRALLGHSLGGKVVLRARARASALVTFVVDSSPSAKPDAFAGGGGDVPRVLAMLESLPARYRERQDFVDAVIGRGYSSALAAWLAMNLESEGGGYRLRLELPALRSLLEDYYRVDAWADIGAGAGTLTLIIASRSDSLSAADRQRAAELAAVGKLDLVTLNTGHWVHVEAPEELAEVVAERLPDLSRA